METSSFSSAVSAFASLVSAVAAAFAARAARRESRLAHGDFLTVRVTPAVEDGRFVGAVVHVRNRSEHAVTVSNVWIVPSRRKVGSFAVLLDSDGTSVGFPHVVGAWESLRVCVLAETLEKKPRLVPFRAVATLDDGQLFRSRRFGRRDLARIGR